MRKSFDSVPKWTKALTVIVGVPLLNQAIRRFLRFFFTETDFPGIIQAERDFPQHSSRFDLNEKTLWSGVAVMTQFAFDWQDA